MKDAQGGGFSAEYIITGRRVGTVGWSKMKSDDPGHHPRSSERFSWRDGRGMEGQNLPYAMHVENRNNESSGAVQGCLSLSR